MYVMSIRLINRPENIIEMSSVLRASILYNNACVYDYSKLCEGDVGTISKMQTQIRNINV